MIKEMPPMRAKEVLEVSPAEQVTAEKPKGLMSRGDR